tara:strand:- start:320 stop:1252 length:933 start_codon:yes stop_codon:yes gene_type:complete
MSEETEVKQAGDAEEPVVIEVEETVSEAPEEKVATQEPATETVVEQEASEEPSDELETYSKNVQNRIKKQTAKYHQEKRDKEEAQRFAEKLLQENNNLKAHNKQLDSGYLNQYGAKVDAQLQSARQAYKEAYESGDSDAVVKAQEYLSRATIDSDRYNVAKQRADQKLSVEQAQPEEQRQAVAPQQAAPPPPRQEDPKARDWAEKNTWFGQDEVMTYAAFGIHRKMVEEEGFDPLSNEYYTEVDRRLLSEFPAKLGVKKTGGSTQVAPAGSSASRNTKKGRRTVTLTPSQVAMAKKLNVPISEYAKYVKD